MQIPEHGPQPRITVRRPNCEGDPRAQTLLSNLAVKQVMDTLPTTDGRVIHHQRQEPGVWSVSLELLQIGASAPYGQVLAETIGAALPDLERAEQLSRSPLLEAMSDPSKRGKIGHER